MMFTDRECRQIEKQLPEFMSGEMEKPAMIDIKEHLSLCSSCSQTANDLRMLRQDLHTWATTSPTLQAPPAILNVVLARHGRSFAHQSPDKAKIMTARVESPLGMVAVGFRDNKILFVDNRSSAEIAELARRRFGAEVIEVDRVPAALEGRLHHRLFGENASINVDLSSLTEFQQKVLQKVAEIPRGQVRSYEWIARATGHPRAVRAVGSAVAHNPIPLIIPCHRVVRADGQIGAYSFGPRDQGPTTKRTLLRGEGVDVDELERLGHSGMRYVGSDTTHIFCLPTCRHARRVQPQHRMLFKDESTAIAAGYRACKVCKPAEQVPLALGG